MIKSHYDVVIVGAGAMGSASAYQLSRNNLSVLVVDKFKPPHTNGSSHGQSRLLRCAYAEGEKYVPFARRAIMLWKELEEEADTVLFEQCGVLYTGSKLSGFITDVTASAQLHNVDLQLLDHKAASELQFGSIPDGWRILFEPEGGYLHTEKCIAEMLRLSEVRGAHLMTETSVLDVGETKDGVWIETDKGVVSANAAILSAGPWIGDLVPSLRTKVRYQRKVMHWFDADKSLFSKESGFKPFVSHDENTDTWFYGVPDIDGSGVKIGAHNYENDVSHPDQVDRAISAQDTSAIEEFVQSFFPALGRRLASQVCLYTTTPNTDFILDRLPGFENAYVCSGFSGHGFKFAPAVGEIMCEMVLKQEPRINMTSFVLTAHE